MPASTLAVTHISLRGAEPSRTGKVRDVFDLGDRLVLAATDRLSAFDVVLPNGIPDKGKILNQLSAFWFRYLAAVVPNHMISIDDVEIARAMGDAYDETQLGGRCMLVEKCDPILIESVARGHIAGSLYKDYLLGGGPSCEVELYGLHFPSGLRIADPLPEAIYTPATKAQTGHDENISFEEAAQIAGLPAMERCREATLGLFEAARAKCDDAGIILADTKFEFGILGDGIKLIDECLTPDSSRFWPKNEYEPGRPQSSLDKQFVRDCLETLDWDKTAPGPELPESVIAETRKRYIDIFKRITGCEPAL